MALEAGEVRRITDEQWADLEAAFTDRMLAFEAWASIDSGIVTPRALTELRRRREKALALIERLGRLLQTTEDVSQRARIRLRIVSARTDADEAEARIAAMGWKP